MRSRIRRPAKSAKKICAISLKIISTPDRAK
jgi:hypothetical protein